MVTRLLRWGYSRLGVRSRKWLCRRAMTYQAFRINWLGLRGFWILRGWIPWPLSKLMLDDFRKYHLGLDKRCQ